jgi:YVTN family beta-propeller protein
VLTRRSVLLAALGASAACRRKKAHGFSGYAFIANEEGGAVAAVDLEVFAVARHIRVDGAPTAVIADPSRAMVYALTPGNGCIHAIRAGTLAFARKVAAAESAISMRMSPDAKYLYVLCRQPRKLVRLSLDRLAADWEVRLPDEPFDFDLTEDGKALAVSYGAEGCIGFIDTVNRQVFSPVACNGEVGSVRFQYSDQLIAANLSERMLAVYKTETRRLVANLPLGIKPEHFCFKADGGELFITGEGMDAVVVADPSYTPEIGKTVLAGHSPGAMAASASPEYLFVANSKSGDVSILDIENSEVIAVTPVGSGPGYIAITPGDEYALVLNQASGDMAVIRIPNITRAVNEQRRWKKGALFMLIPVGSKPVSAAIMPI